MIITIDGPTASGKSSVARLVAQSLGIYYLNSGALYRAIAYLLIKHAGYTVEKLAELDVSMVKDFVNPARLVYQYDGGQEHIFFDDSEITPYLKSSSIDQGSSIVSTHLVVRELLTQFQRTLAQSTDLVIDGRDCGSHVFPNAHVKIFLTAQLSVRALRWQHEQERRGNFFTQQEAVEQLTIRDKRDMERTIAPLIVPHNAHEIDNSHLSLTQTVQKILDIVARSH
jgi:cytidylate kinase